jgi:hypothetical protein
MNDSKFRYLLLKEKKRKKEKGFGNAWLKTLQYIFPLRKYAYGPANSKIIYCRYLPIIDIRCGILRFREPTLN